MNGSSSARNMFFFCGFWFIPTWTMMPMELAWASFRDADAASPPWRTSWVHKPAAVNWLNWLNIGNGDPTFVGASTKYFSSLFTLSISVSASFIQFQAIETRTWLMPNSGEMNTDKANWPLTTLTWFAIEFYSPFNTNNCINLGPTH